MDSPLTSRVANGTTTTNSNFIPIPQLFVSDADLLLVFLSPEGILFTNQTDDPWYNANVARGSYAINGVRRRFYTPDEAASPMGCVQRFQYCNSSKECGRLASFIDAAISALPVFHMTPGQAWSGVDQDDQKDATARRFEMFQATMNDAQDPWVLLNALGPSSLLSLQQLMQGFMGPLPDNQWQVDVSHWFAVHMASVQAAFVNIARGPIEALRPYVTTPDNEYQREMCHNQVSNISNK